MILKTLSKKPILASIAIISFFIGLNAQSSIKGLTHKSGMVVSARIEASEIGVNILKKGGNAFDAMAATELALAVAYPFAGNIGGGGFMVYRLANGQKGALDYREKAPQKAHKDMYLDEKGNADTRKSQYGALAVGVPGTVAGVWEAHKRFGKLPWRDIVQPAIELAEKGVLVTKNQADRLNRNRADFQKVNKEKIPLDHEWMEGDKIFYYALANTLKTIRDKGKKGFYKGKVAKQIANFIQKNGGIITTKDLAMYNAKWRTPVSFTYKDLNVVSMCPPSSGGIAIGQILKSIEPYEISKLGHNSERYVQLVTEASRRAYADRSYYLGDPDFFKVPQQQLLDKEYLKSRMASFSWEKATLSSEIAPGKIPGYESMETTHYSIVDAEGNAVSVTTTLNGAYGSKLYSNELGFFFNNEMDDFSAKPGVPNMFGLVGGMANSIQPGKRMLSSMTPTIVEKDGKLFMVVGSPGGSTIITSVLQNILNVYEFGMGMQESVSKGRFHHQWLPDQILMEPNQFSETITQNMTDKGYKIVKGQSVVVGKVNAIKVLPDGMLEAGADPRGDEAASGYDK